MAIQEHCDDELISSTDAFYLKTRKPYTITKQREKWTEAEHDKFVEALKLYGRAWRRIEEHVGTKTAVQIRSHAQKFFTKVARDYGASADKSIEIPPPRPKRKPMHPYPRKIVIPDNKEISLTEVEVEDNRSPTSVLLAHDSEGLGSMASNSPNSSSADYQLSPRHELSFHAEESSCPDAETKQSFKLFGKTFVIGDYNSSTSSDDSEDVQKSDPEMHSVRCSSSSSSENAETALTQQLVLEFKRSERSAFSQLKSSVIEMKNNKGFMPYKKRVKVEETTASVKMSYPCW